MPSYLAAINGLLAAEAARHPDLVQFGENIDKGSKICGIARGLPGRVLNVGNCENTHVGVGLGLMLNGGSSVLYMKQLDFLPLAMDQIANTCNFLRCAPAGPAGSFSIVVIVCDHGFQGPQSSFHDLAGLCAMGRVNGYTLTDRAAAEHIVSTQLAQPGFRILAVSQRMFSTELLDVPVLYSAADASLFQYTEGSAATIVCFGFSLPAGLSLARRFAEQNNPAALFSVHPVLPHRWRSVVESAARTRRVIALDDAKGPCSLAHKLLHQVAQAVPGCRTTAVTREEDVSFRVSADCFEPNLEALAEQCYSLSS